MLPAPNSYASLATQTVLSVNCHLLARISIVDYNGEILLDSLVKPTQEVIDWFVERTGFEASYFLSYQPNVIDYEAARLEAVRYLYGKIVVGYKLWESLDALQLSHPADKTRDVATYFAFQTALQLQDDEDGLQVLMREFMHRTVRDGFDNPVEDARAIMDLFRSAREDWEGLIENSVWPALVPPEEFERCYT